MKLDHGKIALQAESAELFYRNIKVRPLTQGRRHAAGAEAHRGLVPGAAEGDAGRDARRAPSDAIVLFDGKSLDAWKSAQDGRRRGLEDRQRRDGRRSRHRRHPDQGECSATCSCTWSGAIRKLPPDKVNQDRGNSGIFLQDVYEVQVLDNFENPTYVNGMVGSHLQAVPAAGERHLARRDLEHLRHHLHRAALCRRRLADVTGAAHRAAQRRAGAEQRRCSRAAPRTSARLATGHMATCRCACRITGTWCATGTSGCASSNARAPAICQAALLLLPKQAFGCAPHLAPEVGLNGKQPDYPRRHVC